jgi:uncharacterized GH25 family protein
MRIFQPNRFAFPALLCASFPISARAHEFWIEPSSYRAEVGAQIGVALRVGEHFKGKPVGRASDRVERFAAVWWGDDQKRQEAAIEGKDGDEPAGELTPSHAGLHLVIYDSDHARIELEGEKFESYLKAKGLEAIREQRRTRNENAKAAREVYSRCAKSLIFVADESKRDVSERDHAVGMPLEIVAQFNPYAEQAPRDAKFLVYFDGKPLPNVQVTALSRQQTRPLQTQRSTKDGEITLSPDRQWPLADRVHPYAADTEPGRQRLRELLGVVDV